MWLIALTAFPLGGALFFAASDVAHVSESHRKAQEVGASAQELVELTELRSRLLDEASWAAASHGVDDLGFSSSDVERLTGLDIDANRRAAETAVDDTLLAVDWRFVELQVDRLRSNPPSTVKEHGAAYVEVTDVVRIRTEVLFNDLMDLAGNVDDGADLVASLRVLAATADARRSVTLQLTAYLEAQLAGETDNSRQLALIAEHGTTYRNAIDSILRTSRFHASTRDVLSDVLSSSAAVAFRASMAIQLATGGQDMADDFVERDETSWNSVRRILTLGSASVDAHLELVEAAGTDVVLASEELGGVAQAGVNRAQRRMLLISVVSGVFVLALSRAIGRPLQKLAQRAQDLQDGEVSDDSPELRPSGPTEVRQAAFAINEAASHLQLAERQANALAVGELDHPSLSESTSGSLGASLQAAVRTLTRSLTLETEFRDRLEHEATHDPLTQLANRRASLEQLGRALARARRTNGTVAILFIDLDGFKAVNDRKGHAAGDTVLTTISDRLIETLRAGDHVGRLGGDEFMVIAEPISGVGESVALAERVVEIVSQPIDVEANQVRVGASIGIAMADANTSLTPEELMRDADLAVYKAKDGGRGRVELCNASLREELAHRNEIENAIREALLADEFELHYQPIVDSSTRQVRSFEALLRWNRGSGLVMPDDFIPIAERSELVTSIDRWVICRAAEQLRAWQGQREPINLPIAVNVSGRSLVDTAFVDDVLDPLRERRIDPRYLIVEITERSLVEDLETASANLEQLRAAGIRVAIDDFGTGFTSLAHLRSLPIDIIKIDRSFTLDETATSLVRLIIDTGHLLRSRVIAEGIETLGQAEALLELGADELQGYAFGRPAPAAVAVQSIERNLADSFTSRL
ncbi:MAG: putative bifunctional diguanylate cyclase/phosphodiesterase [Acidimicrobiales bacterium]